MAVSASYAPLTYAWTNTDQAFPVTWPFFSGTLRIVRIDPHGNETVKTLGTDYTESGGTDSAGLPAVGTATMIGAAQAGTIRIERETPKTQADQWTENDPFPAKVVEAALDRLILIAQEAYIRFRWRGAWTTGIEYQVADVVTNANGTYVCIDDHAADVSTEPGAGASWLDHWALLVAGGADGADGSSPQWITQSGAPGNELGANGDMYLDTEAGDIYGPKANGSWGASIINIKGPAGAGTGDMLKSENLSGLSNYATARANLGLTIGTHVQAYDPTLQSLATLGSAADRLAYTTGVDTWAEAPLTAAGRALLDDADAAAQRTTLGLGNTATMNEASVSEYRSAIADRPISPDTAWSAANLVALSDATTIAVDFSAGFNFAVTLGGNRTLGNPTNVKAGQTGIIEIKQDATGNRTLAFGANWKFPGGTAPSLTTTANARDVLSYVALSSTVIFATLIADVK